MQTTLCPARLEHNYYQDTANPDGGTWTPNGREIENADVNVHLNGRSGFIKDNGLGAPHSNVFAWYGGTVDFALDEVTTGYQIERTSSGFRVPAEPQPGRVYDRLGSDALGSLALNDQGEEDLAQLLDSGGALAGWYSSDDETNSEGLSEGWYLSVLGGGQRPTVDLSNRTSVSEDNTDPDGTPGDFAVPTVFNGNFDYGINNTPGREVPDNLPVPGWSYHNGEGTEPLLYEHLVDVDDIDTLIDEFDVELEDESNSLDSSEFLLSAFLEANQATDKKIKLSDGGIEEITHNAFVVPEWGNLWFDLHVPNPNGGKLQVSIKESSTDTNWLELHTIRDQSKITEEEKLLKGVDLTPYNHSEKDIINRIDYGSKGFERFTLDIPDSFRGKKAILRFELIGNNEVAIDNIWIQSEPLNLGNPTEARYNPNDPNDSNKPNSYAENYLQEKAQYSLSYNNINKTPNWVAWTLDKTWLRKKGQPAIRTNDFRGDITLPTSFVPNVGGADYEDDRAVLPQYDFQKNPLLNPDTGQPIIEKYAPGHLTPSASRNRSDELLPLAIAKW